MRPRCKHLDNELEERAQVLRGGGGHKDVAVAEPQRAGDREAESGRLAAAARRRQRHRRP
jgi:hypothetical protein